MDDIYACWSPSTSPTASLGAAPLHRRRPIDPGAHRGDFTTAQLQERLREALDAHRADVLDA
jgi:hypothetical protein